jgi:hypothetical protein
MSKRVLAVVLALGMLTASSAFASRARLMVMGTGDAGAILGNGTTNFSSGSFYYDDAYNIFYNPSYVNDFKNWATIEKSNFAGSAVTQGSSAQGGFTAGIEAFNLGFYLNRQEAIQGTYAASDTMRPFEVYLGADMGVKWGVGVAWSNNRQDTGTDDEINLKLGAQVAGFEPFGSFLVKGDNKVGGTDNKNKGWVIGTRYRWGEWIPYLAWSRGQFDVAGTTAVKNNTYGVGIGRNAKVAEGARLAYAIGFWRTTSTANAQNGRNIIPIDVSAEADATSWLTVRAGLHYRLWDRLANQTTADTTSGRVGLTTHLGKADVDWALGVGAADEAIGATPNTHTTDTQLLGVGPGFFTGLGVTYHW